MNMALKGGIMALIQCIECKEEVSDKAFTCPKCGAPTALSKKKRGAHKKISYKTGCLITFLVFAVPILIIGILAETDDDSQKSTVANKDRSNMANIQCQNFVKANLKSPATADFPWFDFKYWNKPEQIYIIKSYVDSQNSFGAILRSTWHCKIQYNKGDDADSRNWELLELEILP